MLHLTVDLAHGEALRLETFHEVIDCLLRVAEHDGLSHSEVLVQFHEGLILELLLLDGQVELTDTL
jgi:hypothetical protein